MKDLPAFYRATDLQINFTGETTEKWQRGWGILKKKMLSEFGSDYPGIFKINWRADYYSILD